MELGRAAVLACVLASGCGRIDIDPGVAAADAQVHDTTFAEYCATSDATICESFEGNTDSWDFNANPTAPVITTERSYSATHSLLTEVGHPNDESYLAQVDDDIASMQTLYARAWFYLPSVEIIGHVNLVTLESASAGFSLVAIDDFTGEGPVIEVFADSLMPHGFDIGTPPRDRWFCAELEIEMGTTTGRIKGTIDGGTAQEISAVRTNVDTAVSDVKYLFLGASFSGPTQSTPLHAFVDDFLLTGHGPTGCYP